MSQSKSAGADKSSGQTSEAVSQASRECRPAATTPTAKTFRLHRPNIRHLESDPVQMQATRESEYLDVPVVAVERLHEFLGSPKPLAYPDASREKPLDQWNMEVDDAPIFRFIYRSVRPRRHLEFGTWQGFGTVLCLEESSATVWTINPPHGELDATGTRAYGFYDKELPEAQAWAQQFGLRKLDTYASDALGFIGRFYLEKNLGHRVCQIFCDSTQWDSSALPDGFFDTVLIDGGHQVRTVITDTTNALRLVRPGGIILWHDFCPPVFGRFDSTRGVTEAIYAMWDHLTDHMQHVFWVEPSWILLGIRK